MMGLKINDMSLYKRQRRGHVEQWAIEDDPEVE